jgi:predicted O-methyltransferase YrrM
VVAVKLVEIAGRAVHVYGAMQKPTELAGLLAVAAAWRPRVVWEIGTATGGTLWALAKTLRSPRGTGLPAVRFVSIDVPGGAFSGGATRDPDELVALITAAGGPESRLAIIHGDSRTVELPDEQPDFVLVDGDHSAEGVRADWERYAPLVRPGGIVAFHDILPHPPVTGVEVAPVWAEIAAAERWSFEIVDRMSKGPAGNDWGGFGVVLR